MQPKFPVSLKLSAAKALLATALCLLGAAAKADDAQLQTLYESAKSTGQTNVSLYAPATGSYAAMFKAFEARFPGITITATDMWGSALFSRLEAEAASKTYGVDVVASGIQDFATLTGAGYLSTFTPAGIEDIPSEFISPDSNWFTFQLVPIGPVINTTRLGDKPPKKWADLLDPALKGQMSITSPTTLTVAPLGLTQMREFGVIDDAWIEKFAALTPAINTSTSGTMLSVSQGQYSMAPLMVLSVYNVAKAKGAPVEFFYLEEGNPVMPITAGVMKTAPNPKAGELFISWVLSEEGARLLAKETGSIGTRKGAPGVAGMPEGHKLLSLPANKLGSAIDTWMAGPAKLFAR